ncbi:hypothetical protein [Xanthomonas sp. NCPPB 2632]|uniref:hypothetical protein n=1 Tax=Xanthomonas sp. NCPPB 2632 TaxID=3240912 RepID=UPI0035175D78
MQLFLMMIAALACGTGLKAAYLWWRASRIPVMPSWVVEPGETVASLQGWMAATLDATHNANSKNACAAIWTAASVGLSGIATIISVSIS